LAIYNGVEPPERVTLAEVEFPELKDVEYNDAVDENGTENSLAATTFSF